jgi:hypothetical protein
MIFINPDMRITKMNFVINYSKEDKSNISAKTLDF